MLKNMLINAGLVKPDEKPTGFQAVVTAPDVSSQSFATRPLQAVSTGSADSDMVESLKTSVLAAAPIIGRFMQNVAIAKGSFPNDNNACMKAALAFTQVDKASLIGELDRAVSAALSQAKKGMESERHTARESAVGSLEKELMNQNSSIKEGEARIVELQQSIAQKRAEGSQLQEKIRNAEADLQRQDNVVNASFAQVEQFLASLKQTISTL